MRGIKWGKELREDLQSTETNGGDVKQILNLELMKIRAMWAVGR